MTSIGDLYRLQEADLALEAATATLADVQGRIGESDELIEVGREVEERTTALRAAEKTFKEQEFETDELGRKSQIPEQRLYGGKVQNPKELEDLQREVDSLKRRRAELDDLALRSMEIVDEAERLLKESQERHQELSDTFGAEQEELRSQQAQLEEEIASLSEEREGHATGIDATLLSLYDGLRKRKGQAMAMVQGGACQGCRISLPMNLNSRARGGNAVVQCINCERILFAG